jgi:hypothetical protein
LHASTRTNSACEEPGLAGGLTNNAAMSANSPQTSLTTVGSCVGLANIRTSSACRERALAGASGKPAASLNRRAARAEHCHGAGSWLALECGVADGHDENPLRRISAPTGDHSPGDLNYLRLTLSFRDVEDFLAERGIAISYETIRRWVNHFGPIIAAELRKRRPKQHAVWHLDEVYLKSMGAWSICGAWSTGRARFWMR